MQLNTLKMVHEFIRAHVQPGDVCIDATAGKGRDTALLCRLAGESGRVLAFDIQPEALNQTRALLEEQGLQAQLVLDSHEKMEHYAQPGTVQCVVFNFGRLPGGDPNIFTTADSSVRAVQAALNLLKSGGVVAIALYYGKQNGYGERDALLQFLAALDSKRYSVLACSWINRPSDPPMPIFIQKD